MLALNSAVSPTHKNLEYYIEIWHVQLWKKCVVVPVFSTFGFAYFLF